MGYSARYHAASIAAIFLALAIGILIGVEFGGDVVSGTSRSLEGSLQGDLEEARGDVEAVELQLDRERDFGRLAYPALISGRMQGLRVGLIAFGDLPVGVGLQVRAALEPAGAELAAVAVVREPPDTAAIASAGGGRWTLVADDGEALEEYGRAVGEEIVTGGDLLDRTQGALFSRLSGTLGDLDAVVVTRTRPEELAPEELGVTDRLETGLMDGIVETAPATAGAELTDAPSSSIAAFRDRGMPTVDDLDLVAGKVALVLALRGAEGNFGVKGSADQLLPDVLIGPLGPAGPR
jgi:hypothetical protein